MRRKMQRMLVGLVVMLSLCAGGMALAQSKSKMMSDPASAATGMGMPKAGLVDLNTADEAALTKLKGIGPAKAKSIIKYRQEHGGFKSVDELTKVPGIGAKTLAALKPMVTVGAMGQ